MSTLKAADIIEWIASTKTNGMGNPIGTGESGVAKGPLLHDNDAGSESTRDNILEQVRRKLANPMDFPTLDLAILPEDAVCIVLEPGTPGSSEIVVPLLECLSGIGVDDSQVTLLLAEGTREEVQQDLRDQIATAGFPQIRIQTHRSDDRNSVGFLSTSEDGNPILLNAQLVHSDFVIPIGVAKSGGWKSQVDFLYPYFSDQESQARFFQLDHQRRIELVAESTRWLGTLFSILVVAADDNQILDILVGKHDVVGSAAQKHFRALENSLDLESTYGLVIAEVGTHLYASKREVQEVIDLAREFCRPKGGCVILWNDDREVESLDPPDPADDWEDAEIAEDLSEVTTFVCTDQPVVRSLGYSEVTESAQVRRLIEGADSCLVLRNFQRYGNSMSANH